MPDAPLPPERPRRTAARASGAEPPLYLGDPLIVAIDMRPLAASDDDAPAIDLRFTADARQQSAQRTRPHVGRQLALVAGGKALYVSPALPR
ncbi:hypothetical protein K5L01_13200 [Stenotrophomonas sp. CPCC 101365]|uniref:Uncharacterized protein n=2 Tax=Stenotrophomonas mori TaxID=2871096 RepID=A0ABT0SK10_9GAMM|nr:hypothetical protein [Stenotrophomonas mori]